MADDASQDSQTNKISVSGIFDQIEVEAGTDYTAPACLFFGLRSVHGSVTLTVLYRDLDDNGVLLEREITVPGEPLVTATVCLPLSRIPVPRAGSYLWIVQYRDDPLGESRVEVKIRNGE